MVHELKKQIDEVIEVLLLEITKYNRMQLVSDIALLLTLDSYIVFISTHKLHFHVRPSNSLETSSKHRSYSSFCAFNSLRKRRFSNLSSEYSYSERSWNNHTRIEISLLIWNLNCKEKRHNKQNSMIH